MSEAVDRLLLGGLRLAGVAAEEDDVLRGEASQRRELGHGSRQAEQVRDAHPVERAGADRLRRVEVGVHVEVDEPGRRAAGGERAGHGADSRRAVAAEDDRRVAGADRRLHPLGDLARRLHDAGRVLGAPVLAVRAPASERDVAEVGVGFQAGLAKRPRCLLLAGREGSEGCGGADEGGRHNRCRAY